VQKRRAIRTSTSDRRWFEAVPSALPNPRIEPRHGVVEVGNIYFSPRLCARRRPRRYR
jgi:hypothetical protein